MFFDVTNTSIYLHFITTAVAALFLYVGNQIVCIGFYLLSLSFAGTALWNNMLEPVGKKTPNWRPLLKNFKCPTKESPYLITYDNSGHS